MAIKRLMGVTAIAETQFRSLNEVNRYLSKIKDELKDIDSLLRSYQAQFAKVERQPILAADLTFKIGGDPKKSPKIVADQIDKVVIPKLDVLKKNFDVVDVLTDKIQELEAMEANVAVTMKGMRGQPETLKAIKSMKAQADTQMKRALEYLEEIGQKYAPSPFKDLLKDSLAKLNEDLQYESYKMAVYAHQTPSEEQAFTVYLMLKNLKDETGDIYPKFYIVFTCVLAPITGDKTKLSIEYHVTVMHEFQTPGRFHVGKRVFNAKEALSEIGNLLSIENISHAIGTLPHGMHSVPKDWLKAGAGAKIKDVEVDPASFTFIFQKNVKLPEAQQLANSLYPQVKGMLSHISPTPQVKMRMLETDEGNNAAKFTIINMAKEGQISVQDLEWLKNAFKLDDRQASDIVKVINKNR